ncbi:MAG: flagellar hook protein FlgE [Janthinobacterium lividum]
MSIFGALNTAVSGLSAQSHAFTDISNNISNSQTVGYKATDTNFSDYVLTSGAAQGTAGTVLATTASQNEAQGTITSSSNALALAVSGRGFFSVNEESGDSTTSVKAFKDTAFYTRNGNFTENNLGYLVNSSNEYLNGYVVDSKGVLNTNSLQTINVSNVKFRPTQTSTVTDAATLPGAGAAADTTATSSAVNSTIPVYDSTGTPHSLALNWTYSAADSSWTVSGTLDGAATPNTSAQVKFDANGLISSVAQQNNIGSSPATYGTATTTSGAAASLTLPATFGGVSQPMTISLGSIGSSSGTTMQTDTAGTGAAATVSSDSVTTGVFKSISMTSDGNIMASFDNNQTQLVGKVPLAIFADANALSAVDGEAFTATSGSGAAVITLAGKNGAGDLETSSVENSTTSLDTDLTKLITAQQAYGANAKVVTTANEMLQTVLSMKQ